MRKFLPLGLGLFLGLIGAVLFLSAGFPPALVAVIFWLAGGAIGISLLQFAFLGKTVESATEAARAKPLRAFLTGLLVMELPILAASCFQLAGAEGLAALSLLVFFGSLLLLLWPANVSYLVGQRVAPGESKNRQVAAGSLVVASSMLVPVLGWLWLMYLVVVCTGGFCLRGRYATAG
jgi:NADH:ubiquinone oxidoreductase subunit 6 (subunit J)